MNYIQNQNIFSDLAAELVSAKSLEIFNKMKLLKGKKILDLNDKIVVHLKLSSKNKEIEHI